MPMAIGIVIATYLAFNSVIIGIVAYIGCLLMGLPYAPLIAFVIGVTDMVPVFGPFLGAIPCIFILFLVNAI